jgi:hypothetical protein
MGYHSPAQCPHKRFQSLSDWKALERRKKQNIIFGSSLTNFLPFLPHIQQQQPHVQRYVMLFATVLHNAHINIPIFSCNWETSEKRKKNSPTSFIPSFL